jgi:hypothetical protein
MVVGCVSQRSRTVGAMELPPAITTWTGVGAATNARRSLDEWARAQDEVAALLARLEAHGVSLPGPEPRPTSTAA